MAKTQIMLVEDEGIIALNTQKRLLSLGYDVCAMVSSGEEAIKKAEEHKPSLVLMDIRLRGEMDGIEAAQKIRERFNIPIVYFTAISDKRTLEQVKITEPYGYIIKPFEDSELHATIEKALLKSRKDKKSINM